MDIKKWLTNDYNPEVPMSEYLYGPRHIVMLLFTLATLLILAFVFKNRSKKQKDILLLVLGIMLLVLEVANAIVDTVMEDNRSFESFINDVLPVEICGVMLYVYIITAFTKKQSFYNFSVICGILSTSAFLLYPGVGINREYVSFPGFYSVITHIIGFVFSVLVLIFGYAKFNFKDIWKIYVCFAVMFIWGAIANFLIFPGKNLMYMIEDPLKLNLKIPYQIVYLALIAFYISIFYTVSYLKNKYKKPKYEVIG